MKTSYTQFPKKFVPYETNRITCDFRDEEHFLAAMEELRLAGFDSSKFYFLQGGEGIRALDPEGIEHGIIAIIKRKVHSMISESEDHAIKDIVRDLKNGMIHLSVPAAHKKERDVIHQIMDDNEGQKVKFMGFFTVEEYESNAS